MGRRKAVLVFGVWAFLVLVAVFGVVLNVPLVSGSGTIYIRADGSIDPPDAPISTVDYVTYTFTGNINDSVVVERDNIVVDGAGYTLQGTGIVTGIDLDGRSNVTIKNMEIKAFYYGIYLYESSNNSIEGNSFVNNGLWVWASYGNVVSDNLVNGKPLVYLEEVSDYVVEDAGQVILVKCNNITVENLNLSNTIVGVQLWKTNNTKTSGNNVTNNDYGILLSDSSSNSISGNNITNNWDGIYLGGSSNNNISGNNITANNEDGIYLRRYSNNNTISGNNIANNEDGIGLSESSNNVIYHNNFINNVEQADVTP